MLREKNCAYAETMMPRGTPGPPAYKIYVDGRVEPIAWEDVKPELWADHLSAPNIRPPPGVSVTLEIPVDVEKERAERERERELMELGRKGRRERKKEEYKKAKKARKGAGRNERGVGKQKEEM